jgi:hypothetical protein
VAAGGSTTATGATVKSIPASSSSSASHSIQAKPTGQTDNAISGAQPTIRPLNVPESSDPPLIPSEDEEER